MGKGGEKPSIMMKTSTKPKIQNKNCGVSSDMCDHKQAEERQLRSRHGKEVFIKVLFFTSYLLA